MVVVGEWFTRGTGRVHETGPDVNSIYVASKTGLTDMEKATVILRGAVTDSGDPNGT